MSSELTTSAATGGASGSGSGVVSEVEANALALTMLPRLQGVLRGLFSGPHTQFACACLAASAPSEVSSSPTKITNNNNKKGSGNNGPSSYVQRHVIIVVSCTQLFVCDDHAFVHRVIHLERLLAVYVRPVENPKLVNKHDFMQQQQNQHQGDNNNSPGNQVVKHSSDVQRGKEGQELEILLVIDGEHDLLLQGKMTCDGIPAKPFVPLLQVLHENVKPVAPLVVHSNNPAPLSEIARLSVPPNYRAPLPIREETHENCPCWREGDVINISMQEFEQRVHNIFVVYCPERLPTVKEVCKRFAHRKGGALQHLTDRYGTEPTQEHADAVASVLSRESVNQSLFAAAASKQPTFSAIAASQRSNETAPKEIPVDPLYFPALLLTQRPSGGCPRIKLHISPAPAIPSGVSLFSPYIRAGYLDGHRGDKAQQQSNIQGDNTNNSAITLSHSIAASGSSSSPSSRSRSPPSSDNNNNINNNTNKVIGPVQLKEKEFWYLSNEGFALSFDITNASLRPFGFAHGDRVLSTIGMTSGKFSVIVGVRDGTLWVHDEGTLGATALVGFRSHEDLERLNGWMLVESVHLHELRTMEVVTEGGFVETLDIAPEILYPRVGFFHGEVVSSKKACSAPTNEAVVLGLARTGELFVQWLITSDTEPLNQTVTAGDVTAAAGSYGKSPASASASGAGGGSRLPTAVTGGGGAGNKPLLAVDVDVSTAMLNAFQRKKLPQKEAGAVARNAVSVGKFFSCEELVKAHGWVPIACRKVCCAPAIKASPTSPLSLS